MKPTLTIGEWEIDPIDGQIRRSGEIRRLRPKTMAVLLCLASEPDELVERDELIARADAPGGLSDTEKVEYRNLPPQIASLKPSRS